ncbi:MAG: glycoside hydrolase family 2 TIM barrel-domain containing protein, partial [Verrucomicrobiota bacterium]
RNHPSVLFWSLGNESFHGPNHAAMAAWLRHQDPTRPIQYESGYPGPEITDILAPMYPKLDWVVEELGRPEENRPMIMCEYAYCKGNATGNFYRFWQLVDRHARFQGGFVWDWSDKAILQRENGETKWLYGDEQDEEYHTHRMCLNGVVFPDLAIKPGAVEMQKCQAPVTFHVDSDDDLLAGRVLVRNRQQALDLSRYLVQWELTEDGEPVESGELAPPSVPPGNLMPRPNSARAQVEHSFPTTGEDGLLEIPFEQITVRPGRELHLTLRLVLKDPTPWAEAGHLISWEQFPMPLSTPTPSALPRKTATKSSLQTRNAEGAFTVAGETFAAVFDNRTGLLTALENAEGHQLLQNPLQECFFRAPTDIDYSTNPEGYGQRWIAAGLDRLERTVEDIRAGQLDEQTAIVRVCARHQPNDLPHGLRSQIVYTLLNTGDILADCTVTADNALPPLPRIGMRTQLPGQFSQLAWLGRGPHENYPDRKHSALTGLHTATVDDQYVPYIFPQENGGKTDVRRLTLTDKNGAGLLICGAPTLHFSALPCRLEDLYLNNYYFKLPSRNEVNLHLDGFHTGLGGDTGWRPNIYPEFLIPPGRYNYRLRLRPIINDDNPTQLHRETP